MSDEKKGLPGRPHGAIDRYPRKPHAVFDVRKKRAFLKQLEDSGSIASAAAITKTARKTIYNHMDKDPKFKAQVEAAKERAMGNLESYVHKRVLDGETITVKDADGNIVSTTHKPASAALVARLLDSTEAYGKNKTENHLHIHGEGGGALEKLAQALGVNLPQQEQVVEGEIIDEDEEDDD